MATPRTAARTMPPPTEVCIRDSIAAIEASRAQLRSLKATLDASQAALRTSRALCAPGILDRSTKKVEDEAARKPTLYGHEMFPHELEHLRAALESFVTIGVADDEMRTLIAEQWPY